VLASTRRGLSRCRALVVEAAMARRRIGQEELLARAEPRWSASLSELAALLDWVEIDRALAGISASAKGELGWPPLARLTALRGLPEGSGVVAGELA
jgi:hypothetical protein